MGDDEQELLLVVAEFMDQVLDRRLLVVRCRSQTSNKVAWLAISPRADLTRHLATVHVQFNGKGLYLGIEMSSKSVKTAEDDLEAELTELCAQATRLYDSR